MIEITDQPIDVQKIILAASRKEAGAVNTFIGTVRNNTSGNKVIRLEYEAYEPMAISEIQKIIDRTTEQWKLTGFAVSHRVGILQPGEIAVVVAVSTPHRKNSLSTRLNKPYRFGRGSFLKMETSGFQPTRNSFS
jgi:molybdopterin synthase catalytic subunit